MACFSDVCKRRVDQAADDLADANAQVDKHKKRTQQLEADLDQRDLQLQQYDTQPSASADETKVYIAQLEAELRKHQQPAAPSGVPKAEVNDDESSQMDTAFTRISELESALLVHRNTETEFRDQTGIATSDAAASLLELRRKLGLANAELDALQKQNEAFEAKRYTLTQSMAQQGSDIATEEQYIINLKSQIESLKSFSGAYKPQASKAERAQAKAEKAEAKTAERLAKAQEEVSSLKAKLWRAQNLR